MENEPTDHIKPGVISESKTKHSRKGTMSSPPRMSQSSTKKRKVTDRADLYSGGEQDGNENARALAQDKLSGRTSSSKRPRKKKGDESVEKRLRKQRSRPPGTYLKRLERVRSQRMFLIDRHRSQGEDGTHEEEVFDIAGSTGNIYQVKIAKVPSCTCPDASKGNQCKHIIYVMVTVLKARNDLAYQMALLSSELTEIFANAPVTPQSNPSDDVPLATDTGGLRKAVEGDCPVCVMEFESDDDIVWCKAACGNNIHRQCFEQWARSKLGVVKCVYCRTIWKGDEDSVKRVAKGGVGVMNEEGYVNVGAELGSSIERDTSSYHQHWVTRQYGDPYHRY